MIKELLIFAALSIPQVVRAADWKAIVKSPAQVTVLQMQAKPLVVSADKNGWARVPTMLSQNGAVIFATTNESLGVADIQVVSDGYLLIACNWDYQGNNSGDWAKDAWDERKFKSKGWDKLTKGELDGELIRNNNRVQTLFVKRVKKGDTFRLRCNKYEPPYAILIGTGAKP